MKKWFLIIMVIGFIVPIFAQQEKNHEVNSDVKELTEFHDVIYQIWHTGWPQKDIKFLVSLTPEIKKGYASIKKAKLPGILRDKQDKWKDGVKTFGATIDLYKKASAKKDSVGILDAAEKLHSQYENLVRIVKPVTKEIENFHQELYMLYHHYLPNYDYEKVKKSVGILGTRNESLIFLRLPERFKDKQAAYDKIKVKLDDAVHDLLNLALNTNDKEKITKSVDVVHSIYQELEKLFD